MYITHDYIEKKTCSHCGIEVPYYDLTEQLGKLWCEYCLDELYRPEDI